MLVNHFESYNSSALWYAALSYLSADKSTEATCILYALSLTDQNDFKPLDVLQQIGSETNGRSSLGMIEDIILERDSISGNQFTPQRQKGTISDLTTRRRYDFHLITPIENLKEGDIVNYVALETITDTNPIGIAFILQEEP